MTKEELTPSQREIIERTLGIKKSPSFRNWLFVKEGDEEYADCEALVACGVMDRLNRRYFTGYIYLIISPEKYY